MLLGYLKLKDQDKIIEIKVRLCTKGNCVKNTQWNLQFRDMN